MTPAIDLDSTANKLQQLDQKSALSHHADTADRIMHQKDAQRFHDLAKLTGNPNNRDPKANANANANLDDAIPPTLPADVNHYHDPCGPFEGPEKLLELWFAEEPADVLQCQWPHSDARPGHVGLRTVPRHVWETMLDIVKCKVLSVIHGPEVDAYLLSESSMFVFSHKLILKTCGTTTLLLGLERLLEIASQALSTPRIATHKLVELDSDGTPAPAPAEAAERRLGASVVHAFYSRKSFMFPERQKGPHRDWMLEVAVLDRFFDFGAAYTVGKMNGDHWLLWMGCEGAREADAPAASAPAAVAVAAAGAVERPLRLPTPCIEDQTLEILMTQLSAASCARFVFDAELAHPTMGECYPARIGREHPDFGKAATELDRGHALGLAVSNRLGLTDMFKGTQLDAFAFEPCGYSANAVMPRRGRQDQAGYWTIHVTPEEESSYASFETNVALFSASSCPDVRRGEGEAEAEGGEEGEPRTLPQLVTRVVKTFEPAKLSVTLFVATDDRAGEEEVLGKGGQEKNGEALRNLEMRGYRRTERIAYGFERYELVFVGFEKR
ncbi:spermidine resistance protein [Thecaphora frezii]